MLPPDLGTLAQAAGLSLVPWRDARHRASSGRCWPRPLALPFGFLAARNVIPGWVFRFVSRRFARHHSQRRHADLGADLDQRRRARPLRRRAGHHDLRFRRLRQALLRGDRGGRPQGGRRHRLGRRQQRPRLRFGLLPEVLPVMASQVLYYFESNTRSATIIGIVGAGGIGHAPLRADQDAGMAARLLPRAAGPAAVTAIDQCPSRLRFAIIGQPGGQH